jgi:hypothetical protein
MRLPDARTPRPLELIEAENWRRILKLLKEVTAWNQGRKGQKATESIYRHLMLGMLVSLPSLLEGESHARTLHPTARRLRESPPASTRGASGN